MALQRALQRALQLSVQRSLIAGEGGGSGLGGNTRLVAIASAVFDTDKQSVYSDDGGLTWTAVAQPEAGDMRSVTWSPTLALYVAIGLNSELWYGDGTSWSVDHTGLGGYDAAGIAWSESLGLFVTAGNHASGDMASADGVVASTWTQVAAAADESWVGIVWDAVNERFFSICNFDAERSQYSSNGPSWTIGSTVAAGGYGRDSHIATAGGVTIAMGGSDGLLRSTDGETSALETGNGYAAVADNLGSCAAKADGSAFYISANANGYYSADGETWTALSAGVGDDFTCCGWDENTGNLVGLKTAGSEVEYSDDDGQTFTAVTAGLPTGMLGADWRAIVNGGT